MLKILSNCLHINYKSTKVHRNNDDGSCYKFCTSKYINCEVSFFFAFNFLTLSIFEIYFIEFYNTIL